MNCIQYGNSLFHGNSARYGTDGLLMSGSVEQFIALFGNELVADSLTFVVNSKALTSTGTEYAFLLDSDLKPLKTSDGKFLLVRAVYPDWRQFTAGAPLDLYNYEGGQIIGRFYVQTVRQISRKYVEFTCTDCVGILSALSDHGGGIYTGQTIGSIITDIMTGSGLPYTVEQDVADVQAYGRLPRDNRRTNLGRVLVATGATLMENNGTVVIKYLGAGNVENLPQRVIYLNSGEVEYKNPATAVQVTEHAFFQTANDVTSTLFDNTNEVSPAVNQLVVFDEPYYNLTTTGTLTLDDSNENFAIVSGIGTLDGTAYTHTRRVVTESTGVVAAENVLKLEDNELVGIHNSEYVAKRMSNYYKLTVGVRFDAYDATGALMAGNKFNIVDPFGESRTAWLEKKTFNLGNKTKAQMDFAVDWVAGPWGSNIDKYDLLTASGTWTVPTGVTSLTVVLGGGGQAGLDGANGANGGNGSSDQYSGTGEGGEGGAKGLAGSAGYVNTVQFSVSQGDSVAVTIGTGGATNGATGTATTITINGTTYSSANGSIPANGWVNQFSGETYALSGVDGYDGADGGNQANNGGAVNEYTGGARGTTATRTQTYGTATGVGGGGGGAAIGANGYNGEDGDYYLGVNGTGRYLYGIGGDGGDGANATTEPFTPVLSGGGRGGNGGGGGGGGGDGSAPEGSSVPSGAHSRRGYGGSGGLGSAGTAGGDGFALFLYTQAS